MARRAERDERNFKATSRAAAAKPAALAEPNFGAVSVVPLGPLRVILCGHSARVCALAAPFRHTLAHRRREPTLCNSQSYLQTLPERKRFESIRRCH
jgi:hypothetical protein